MSFVPPFFFLAGGGGGEVFSIALIISLDPIKFFIFVSEITQIPIDGLFVAKAGWEGGRGVNLKYDEWTLHDHSSGPVLE